MPRMRSWGVLRMAVLWGAWWCGPVVWADESSPPPGPATGRVSDADPGRYFAIRVVDDQTGRGVPLVELRTVHNTRYVTDSNGLVAFYEPGFEGREVFFHVESHGYEYPKDGFGSRGKILRVHAGASAELKIKRLNIAERLYRITGIGIYADSVLLGRPVPIAQPLLNGQVAGQDTVMAAVWKDRVWWFWGDTNRPKYPLGHFQVSGATSRLPGQGGLPASQGIDLEYFVDQDGFSRRMCPMPYPKHAVWVEGLAVVTDASGKTHLTARYTRMKSLGEMLEHGLAVYDESQEKFVKRVAFDLKDETHCPRGQTFRWNTGGQEWLVFATPFALTRVRPRLEDLTDPARYETFTCLKPGQAWDAERADVDRDASGQVVWGWKTHTAPVGQREERELLDAGRLDPKEARFQVGDPDTGKPIRLHNGSIRWNEFRKAWIMVALQVRGSSYLGEIWLLEAPDPTGPWTWARKIVTHRQYSFYNPTQHDFLDEEHGRWIYFEGTYTTTFSGNPTATPRYDYNQVMYRLDLSDPRLARPASP